jgi:hypothetical protein
MKWLLLFVIVAAVLEIAFLYRSHVVGDRLQVDPHAAQEIEKAKRR